MGSPFEIGCSTPPQAPGAYSLYTAPDPPSRPQIYLGPPKPPPRLTAEAPSGLPRLGPLSPTFSPSLLDSSQGIRGKAPPSIPSYLSIPPSTPHPPSPVPPPPPPQSTPHCSPSPPATPTPSPFATAPVLQHLTPTPYQLNPLPSPDLALQATTITLPNPRPYLCSSRRVPPAHPALSPQSDLSPLTHFYFLVGRRVVLLLACVAVTSALPDAQNVHAEYGETNPKERFEENSAELSEKGSEPLISEAELGIPQLQTGGQSSPVPSSRPLPSSPWPPPAPEPGMGSEFAAEGDANFTFSLIIGLFLFMRRCPLPSVRRRHLLIHLPHVPAGARALAALCILLIPREVSGGPDDPWGNCILGCKQRQDDTAKYGKHACDDDCVVRLATFPPHPCP